MEYAAAAPARPPDHRQQDRRARASTCPALLAQIQATFGKECLPLNLPDAGGTQGGGLLLQPRRAQRFRLRRRGAPRAGRAGGRGRCRLRRPLPQRRRRRCRRAARAAGAGAARRPPDPGVLRLGAQRRRRGRAARRHRQAAAQPDRRQPAGLPEAAKAPQAKPMHAEPDPAKHVLAHVFKVTVDPFVGKLGIFRVHQGTVTKDSLLYVGDGRKPFKVGAPVHAAGQGPCRGAARAAGRHLRRGQGRRDCTSTRCCTTPPRTTTST